MGEDYPPPINHPEFYYGFLGVTLVWQLMFLVIGSDPVRYRTAMLPAMLEKASFAAAVPALYALGRVAATWVGFAAMDATWLVLFVVAFWRTPKEPSGGGPRRRTPLELYDDRLAWLLDLGAAWPGSVFPRSLSVE